MLDYPLFHMRSVIKMDCLASQSIMTETEHISHHVT